jgi:hypothetical protein
MEYLMNLISLIPACAAGGLIGAENGEVLIVGLR